MCSRKFDLKEMYVSEKEDVLEKLAMLIYLRDEPEFKYQDVYLDKEVAPLTFGIGLTQQNKSTYDISKIITCLSNNFNRRIKLFAYEPPKNYAEEIIKQIEDPWITFHIGSKTYTMYWNNIPDVYLIFKNFNYYKQSLSAVYDQLEGVLK
jgi:hypothetical protein